MDATEIARHAAARLAPQFGRTLPMQVEAVLAGTPPSDAQRMDPATAIAFASFLVSAATLAWKVWQDTRPPKPELERVIRVQLVTPETITDAQRDAVISAVVQELPEP